MDGSLFFAKVNENKGDEHRAELGSGSASAFSHLIISALRSRVKRDSQSVEEDPLPSRR
jgi:hypothetical protein